MHDYATAALLLRLSLGTMFIAHALLKYFVFTLPGTAQFFASLGLPGVLGYVVFAAELVGGVLLSSACRRAPSRSRWCRCCSARRGRMPATAGSSRRPTAAGSTRRSGPSRSWCRRFSAKARTHCALPARRWLAARLTRSSAPGGHPPGAATQPSLTTTRNPHEALLLPGACSLAPHIALAEAGVPYTTEKVDLRKHALADGTDYYAINPKGYVPLLELDDGTRISEVAVILQYIADRKPGTLAPAFGGIERYR